MCAAASGFVLNNLTRRRRGGEIQTDTDDVLTQKKIKEKGKESVAAVDKRRREGK